MNDLCTAWTQLSDRQALGEALDDGEQRYLDDHVATCASCAREHAVFSGLSTLIDLDGAARVSTVVTAPRAPTVGPRKARYTRAAAFVMVASVLLAGGALLASRSRQARVPLAGQTTPPTSVRAHATDGRTTSPSLFLLASPGEVEVDGKIVQRPTTLHEGSSIVARRGTACLELEHGVRACLAESSVVRVAELGIGRRRLELQQGKVSCSLEPQRPGTSFGILTRAGTAVAVGTAFSVEVPGGTGQVLTRVLHGTVVVRNKVGTERRVTAHRVATMDDEPRTMSSAEEGDELTLLAPFPARFPHGDGAPPAERVETKVEAAEVFPSPRVVPSRRPSSVRTSEPVPVGRAPVTDDAAHILLVAREARARADVVAALAAYRQLFDQSPHSAEAHAALVPYGELCLDRRAPKAALVAFDRYLAEGGALAEEASFGRIRALRALGQVTKERAAIADFLQSYPASPLGESLRGRALALAPLTGDR